MRNSSEGDYEKDYLEDVDEDVAENTETVKRANGLPDWVVGVLWGPDWYFGQDEEQVHDAEDNSRASYLGLAEFYDFEGQGVFAVLPDEVAEEGDD